MLLFLQEPPPPADPGCVDPSTGQGCQVVQLSPDQLQLLVEHAQGNAYYLSGWLAFILLCLGAIAFILATGGR